MNAIRIEHFRAICPHLACGLAWFTGTLAHIQEHTEARIFNARCAKCRGSFEILRPPDEEGWGRRREREEERKQLERSATGGSPMKGSRSAADE